MRQRTKLIINVTTFIFILILPIKAFAFDWPETNLRPYVGLDFQTRHIGYDQDRGGNVFAKQVPQINIFAGLDINPYLAVELGYESSIEQTKNVRLGPGQFEVGGLPVPSGGFNDINTSVQFQGVFASLLGKYPIWCYPDLQIIGLVGLTSLNIHLTSTLTQDNIGTLDPDENIRTYNQNKVVGRLGIGLQHMFFDCVGVRALATWEDTARFNLVRSKESTRDDVFAKLHGSTIYSIGVFYSF